MALAGIEISAVISRLPAAVMSLLILWLLKNKIGANIAVAGTAVILGVLFYGVEAVVNMLIGGIAGVLITDEIREMGKEAGEKVKKLTKEGFS